MSKIPYLEIPYFEDHERFFKFIKVDQDTQCWNWKGSNDGKRYGVFTIKHRKYKAHRVSCSIFGKDLSVFMLGDHVCRNRSCVNPEHIREVTPMINSHENSNAYASRTTCKRGHDFDFKNTIITKKGRKCKKCQHDYNVWYWKEHKGKMDE